MASLYDLLQQDPEPQPQDYDTEQDYQQAHGEWSMRMGNAAPTFRVNVEGIQDPAAAALSKAESIGPAPEDGWWQKLRRGVSEAMPRRGSGGLVPGEMGTLADILMSTAGAPSSAMWRGAQAMAEQPTAPISARLPIFAQAAGQELRRAPYGTSDELATPSSTLREEGVDVPEGLGITSDMLSGFLEPDALAGSLHALGTMAHNAKPLMAVAGWFPKAIKEEMDAAKAANKEAQYLQNLADGMSPKDAKKAVKNAQAETAAKDVLKRKFRGKPREVERHWYGYKTIELPTVEGVNFDERRPLLDTLEHDQPGTSTTTSDPTARGVKFTDDSQQRLDVAYRAGVKRAGTEHWGDPHYIYHLTGGDPELATMFTRLMGTYSPGQKTDANTLNALEAFARALSGESPDEIMRNLSFKHPRPKTVRGNLERAMQLGRIFQQKVEALAGAEVGFNKAIPIDMWLLRAIGAESDATPSKGMYKLITEAMSKQAETVGEDPFSYMAKVWMGMQDIADNPTPSFAQSLANMELGTPVTNAEQAQRVLGNIGEHRTQMFAARKGTTNPASPFSAAPKMDYDQWLSRVQGLMSQGMERGDVLGKIKMTKDKPVTLEGMLGKRSPKKAKR